MGLFLPEGHQHNRLLHLQVPRQGPHPEYFHLNLPTTLCFVGEVQFVLDSSFSFLSSSQAYLYHCFCSTRNHLLLYRRTTCSMSIVHQQGEKFMMWNGPLMEH